MLSCNLSLLLCRWIFNHSEWKIPSHGGCICCTQEKVTKGILFLLRNIIWIIFWEHSGKSMYVYIVTCKFCEWIMVVASHVIRWCNMNDWNVCHPFNQGIYDVVQEIGGSSLTCFGLMFLRYFWQVALLDGVVMGGGNGISIHGKFRVATENTVSRKVWLAILSCHTSEILIFGQGYDAKCKGKRV